MVFRRKIVVISGVVPANVLTTSQTNEPVVRLLEFILSDELYVYVARIRVDGLE